jgi:putative CocE/NonD family hydrolase
MTPEYMTDDQRFASRRTDVLTYQTSILENDVTFAGKLEANLFVSTNKTAADWVVKLIDVYPGDYSDNQYTTKGMRMGNYQQMVRSEVFRGRFRNSYEKPEPFVPDKVTEVTFPLQDVLHTFKKGHRIMIQVQSTWFPLVDRNPQNYVDNIFMANEEDFVKAVHRVYAKGEHASFVEVSILE